MPTLQNLSPLFRGRRALFCNVSNIFLNDRTPIPVLVPHQQVLFRFGNGLCPCIRALSGKGQSPSFTNGFRVHILVGCAALHGSHGPEESFQTLRVDSSRWLRKVLLPSQTGEAEDGTDVVLRIVFSGRCPSADDGHRCVGLTCGMKVMPIAFECFPCCAVAVGHGLELYKFLIGLCHGCPFPSVGRPTDVERIVVSDSSCHDF